MGRGQGAPRAGRGDPHALNPNPAFPTLGGIPGGYEVYVSEGYAHLDVVTAEDDGVTNNVIPPLAAFLKRNTQ